MPRLGDVLVPAGIEAPDMVAAMTHALEYREVLPDRVAFRVLEVGWMVRFPVPADGPVVRRWGHPLRSMPPASCGIVVDGGMCGAHTHRAPEWECDCGYHAAYDPWDVAARISGCGSVGLLVVGAVGETLWHDNAWRAERYVVHAAVVSEDSGDAPPGWDPEIPVVRCARADVPLVAWEIAEEVRALRAAEEGSGR